MDNCYYSAKQEVYTGTAIWERENGTQVGCTSVGLVPPRFDDVVDLGEVVRYVGKGMPATSGMINEPRIKNVKSR